MTVCGTTPPSSSLRSPKRAHTVSAHYQGRSPRREPWQAQDWPRAMWAGSQEVGGTSSVFQKGGHGLWVVPTFGSQNSVPREEPWPERVFQLGHWSQHQPRRLKAGTGVTVLGDKDVELLAEGLPTLSFYITFLPCSVLFPLRYLM